jgi:uncharacterized membrane protein YagU involved in acid resistance
MEAIVSLTIIGVLATASMVSLMWLITGLTRTHVDMICATGSLYTKNTTNALLPGLFMHFTAGILMTFIYTIFFGLIDYHTAYSYALFGLVVGFFHGVVVTVTLTKLLAENHPVEKYQSTSFTGSLAHIFAHVLYGLVIGTMYGTYLI